MTPGASSNLVPLAQLMAYAAEADGHISPKELETLQDFLGRRYSDSSRSEFFGYFRSAVENRPDIERIISDIQSSLPAYQERLEVYATIRTLLTAAGMTAEESYGLGKIASLLDIELEDADLLAGAAKAAPDFRFPLNRERYLRIVGDPPQGSGEDGRYVDLVVLSIGGVYAVRSDAAELFVSGIGHPPGEVVFIKPLDQVSTSTVAVSFAELSRLFDLAKNRVSCTCRLLVSGQQLVSVGQAAHACFEFRVDESHLLFRKLDPHQAVHLNGRSIESSAVVVPADVLQFETGEVRVLQLLEALDHSTWPLTATADTSFVYRISNHSGDGAEHLLGDLGESVSITISESNDSDAPLRVVCEHAPERTRLADRPLPPGSEVALSAPTVLRIGHHWFSIDPHRLRVDYSKRVVEEFEARGIVYRFRNTTGLSGVTFTARAGELIGVMGGSGAGKSTLLSVLLGVTPPHEGSVRLNGVDLQAQLRRCRSILGYVPQDDLVMDSLTVEENLLYSGRIRLPELDDASLRRRVARVLRDVGLFERRNLRVGSPVDKVLSGGQRKRLNIGIELLADPELFFLDEPTSGLSSQDSQAIIRLLSQLTQRGKLVFVVIHQPSSDIYKMFDKLLILDTGGVLVWYGAAREAVSHFKAYLPHHRDFVECPACGSINPETILTAIEQPLSMLTEAAGPAPRKFDPKFWENAFLLKQEPEPGERGAIETPSPLPAAPGVGVLGRMRTLRASIQRAFVDRARNRTNIVMSVAAPLLLSAVMAAMLRGPDEPYTYSGNTALGKFLFLSTIVFVFFGLMASVNEVIRELALIRRERIAGFRATQYVVAKTLAFLPFSMLQVVIYTAIASLVLQFPYRAPAYSVIQPPVPFPVYFGLVVFLVVQVSFALGLLLSAFLRTQAAAFNWIPLIIIPQILLGGVFVEYEDMPKLANRIVPEYAELTFSRWAYEALLAGEKDFNPPDRINVDGIMALKAQREASGQRFDIGELVEGPRQRWQAERGIVLPPRRISTGVMQDRLLARLRLNDATADVHLLEDAYLRRDRRAYALRPDLPAATVDRVAAILLSPETGWWGSSFSTQAVNANLESARQKANVPSPEPALAGLRRVFTDRSDFPAMVREVAGVQVRVAQWNVFVLIAMILGCHFVSIVRLRYQK